MDYTIYNQYFTVDGVVTQCKNDTVCPTNSLCYFPFPSNPSYGLCGCMAEWGYTGNHCDEYSPHAYYRFVANAILITAGFILFVFLMIDIYQMGRKGMLRKLDAKVTTLALALITVIIGIVRDIYGFLGLMNPDLMYNLKFVRIKNETTVRQYLIGVQYLTSLFAVMNVGIVWLNVAIASKRFRRINNPQLSRRFTICVVVFDSLLFAALVVVGKIEIAYAVIVAIPYFSFVAVLYTYSAYLITNIMKKSAHSADGMRVSKHVSETNAERETSEDRMDRALKRIRVSSIWVVSSIFIAVLMFIIFTFYQLKARTYIPNGSIHPSVLLTDIGLLALYSMIGAVYWYMHEQVKTSVSSASKKSTNTAVVGVADNAVAPTGATSAKAKNQVQLIPALNNAEGSNVATENGS